MKVASILQSKGSEVHTVAEGDTISQAVDLLSAKNIGAVVVRNDRGAVAGILSERDIVRRLKRDGAGALQQLVRAYMTPDPVTCSPDHDLDDVLGLMTNRRIRHLPVMRDGALVGMVSIGDVVKRKIELAEQEAQALKQYISS